ncbi:hypothetical protein COCHEDRAFT_1020436, partial [Bipolaris maydis C5]
TRESLLACPAICLSEKQNAALTRSSSLPVDKREKTPRLLTELSLFAHVCPLSLLAPPDR